MQRFIEGIQIQDLATQMRLGEYKDALILIGRHPGSGSDSSARRREAYTLACPTYTC